MELRQYQTAAIDALWNYWRSSPTNGAPLIVCPTGGGKSLILAEICKRVLAAKPHYRILILTHRKEIISQNAKEIGAHLNIPVGIYSASLSQRSVKAVTCAGIQTAYDKKFDPFQLIIIDECHLLSKNSDSMYQKFLRTQPQARLVGLTATPMRMDQGHLIDGKGLFTDVAYNISIQALIADGFLTPLISVASKEKIDFSDVRKSGHDFNQGELERKMSPLVFQHCAEIVRLTKERKHVLIFCSGIAHAAEVSETLCEMGVKADYVTGEMLGMERDRKLAAFMSGETKALTNCDVLTTGFNFPGIDCVVLLRATQSAGLYIQMVGRGSRCAPEKKNCLVLDFGRNIERFGPIDLIQLRNKKEKTVIDLAPVKFCKVCECAVHLRVMVCPNCGAQFPENVVPKFDKEASKENILSAPEVWTFTDVDYKRHNKEGKPPSFRADYSSGNRMLSDFLCFEHGGYAAQIAQKKWCLRGGKLPAPRTVGEALKRADELLIPEEAEVIREGKYLRFGQILKTRKFSMDEII